jgi:type IV secretory pathway TraG/TraD family ATPase VirD4
MTLAFRIIQHILALSAFLLSQLPLWLWPQKHLHNDRFAYDREVKSLTHETSLGLVLGLDRFGNLLSVQATPEKPHLGHLAIFGSTGAGKTRREIEQLKRWKGHVIVNDPKCDLSNETAEFRKQFSDVFFFAPSEGKGHTYDPLDGIEDERKLYNLAKHLLYVPNEKEPAFTEWATEMLTQLFLAAKLAFKNGLTELRPLPYVAWLINLGGLNDVAREVNAVSPKIAQKLLHEAYHPEKKYEENPYRRSSWDSMRARLYPLLTEDVVKCFNGADIQVRDLVFSKQPITIYLRFHESDLLALSALIKFVWESIIGTLITAYDLAPDKRECQEILLDLEEAGRTGIPNLPDHVSTLRSRKISITAVFQDRSQGYALYGRDRAISMFNNFRYQIYYRQDDLETAQYLETRLGSKSGFAHSKTEHEGSISTGESEQKMPLISAQYIMYDMPDDEIIGFWGKRPFIGKGIPRPKGYKDPEPLQLPALASSTETTAKTPPPEPETPPVPEPLSWRDDPRLLRHWPAMQATMAYDSTPPPQQL